MAVCASLALGAEEEGYGSQAEEPQYYINIIHTKRRIKCFPVRSESWEEMKSKLEDQGYTDLYDTDDEEGYLNILEYDDDEFNQRYGEYAEVNVYSKTTSEPTRAPKQDPRILEFKQFARGEIRYQNDGHFEQIDKETIRTLKASHHAVDRGYERAKGTLDLIKDLNNHESLKLGVKGQYMTKEGIIKNPYYMITKQAIYVLNEEKTTVITTWRTRMSFNQWLDVKKRRQKQASKRR